MKRYRVSGQVTISISVEVDARSKKHARALAEECSLASVHHSTSEGPEGEWVTSGELDGEPKITEVEEVG